MAQLYLNKIKRVKYIRAMLIARQPQFHMHID